MRPKGGAPVGPSAPGYPHTARRRAACSCSCTTRSPSLPDAPSASRLGRRARRLLHLNADAELRRRPGRARPSSATSTAGGSRRRTPQAALSEPVKPITYWLDRTIPLKYRACDRPPACSSGTRRSRSIGFKDAIQVKVVARRRRLRHARRRDVASIRWMTNASPRFGAIGPSHVDPRSGEILDADIGVESLSSRHQRSVRSQVLNPATCARSGVAPKLLQCSRRAGALAPAPHDRAQCKAMRRRPADQLGLRARRARGARRDRPGQPRGRGSSCSTTSRTTTMHEVGHTLGLRHNFRASVAYKRGSCRTCVHARARHSGGSVMDYARSTWRARAGSGGRRSRPRSGPTTTGPSSTATGRSTRGDRGRRS